MNCDTVWFCHVDAFSSSLSISHYYASPDVFQAGVLTSWAVVLIRARKGGSTLAESFQQWIGRNNPIGLSSCDVSVLATFVLLLTLFLMKLVAYFFFRVSTLF